MIPDLKPELNDLIKRISQHNTYYGNRIPESIMSQFQIDEDKDHIGILVPFWLSVLERGRGPRQSNKSSGLINIIYDWMARRSMFHSTTEKGRRNESRFLTLYINRHGNRQFRNKVFVDVYTTEREKTIQDINTKFSFMIGKITMQVL